METIQKSSENLCSIFDHIEATEWDSIVEILELYSKCQNPNKINLTIGAYRDENLQPVVFESVSNAEKIVLEEGFSREYLPFTGDEEFNIQTQTTLFDPYLPFVKENKLLNVIEEKRIVTIQSISGSGSLRIGAEFLNKFINKKIYISDPSWPNHFPIFQMAGMLTETYPYYNSETKDLDFDNLMNFLNNAEDNSVVLLHVCGHNPTGVDPNKEQWKTICELMQKKNMFPFFDLAYQGYISGDLIDDIFPIYFFLNAGFEMFIAQSFSKSMNLYGERAGSLHVIVNDPTCTDLVKQHFAEIAKSLYLVPVGHGSRIIKKVLSTPNLRSIWKNELKVSVERLNYVRRRLYEELKNINTKGNWDHIINQKGMFTYTGLDENQSYALIEKHNIFLVKTGRISLSGLNDGNIPIVARAIKVVIDDNSKD